ncbi:Rib/alpha-like domain-containing protein [Corynebacterium nasicanis]|uniref:Rib/alpha-like domain-containing protein n=1 Tax=Corynebacterium nasicanis TaxID=1448267 RepID=A0ABW1QEE6_9CORY
MISRRYLALLTSAALTTTLVVPQAQAQEVPPAEGNVTVAAENQPAANPAENFTVPAQINTQVMAGGPASTVTVEATGGTGNFEYTLGGAENLPAGVTATLANNVVTLTAARDAVVDSTGYIMVWVRHYGENGSQSVKGVRVNVAVTPFVNQAEDFRILDENATVAQAGTTTGQFDAEGAAGRVVHTIGDRPADWPAGLNVTTTEDGAYTVTADRSVAPGRYSIMHWARHFHPNGQQSVRGAWMHITVTEAAVVLNYDGVTMEPGETRTDITPNPELHTQDPTIQYRGPISAPEGWDVKVDRVTGRVEVTVPEDAVPGDYPIEVNAVRVVNGEEVVLSTGTLVVTVAEEDVVPPVDDEDEGGSAILGSSLPLLLGLGIAGSALAGSALLSSGGSAVADGSAAPAQNNPGAPAPAPAPAQNQAPAPAQGQAPTGGHDPKAVAQAQAANAKAAPAATQAQPKKVAATQPQAQAQPQRQLANTGVQGTLIALAVGLAAIAAGVLLVMRRRTN